MRARRILVVDDEQDIREVAEMSLSVIGGFEVLQASSGEEAVATATSHQPDAILLDVMMPRMDGPATFRALQEDERTRAIPVVLLTAKVQAGDLRQFETLGVTAVLTKPFDPMQLPKELSRVLDWS